MDFYPLVNLEGLNILRLLKTSDQFYKELYMHLQSAMPAMVATGGGDNDGGLGMGGGLIGGLVLGSLLRNGGLGGLGGTGADVGVSQASLAAQLANVTDTLQNTTVMQTLGDIKASVPLAEGQVQLALAGATSDINGNINNAAMGINANIANGLQTAINGQGAIRKDVSEAIAQSLASQSVIKETVLTTGANNLQATLNAKFELAQVIQNDGEKTRALITSFENANTQRLLGERQDQINELLAEGRRRDDRHGIEINMNNTQNQNQLQFQAQAQALNNISTGVMAALQNIQATNQAINIGGLQTANPTNTNTNVRA